jgi:putative CocE/NonD family hydrolase
MNPKLKTPKKAMDVGKFNGPPGHPCSYRYTQEEALRWYDHWLKGIDTGIMDEPPIKLWIGGVNRYRYENEWPLARTEYTKLYIQQYRQLTTAEPVFQNKEPDAFCHNPFDLKTLGDAPSLIYATQPLNQPLEVTGPIAVNLYIALDREDGNILIELLDEIPGGPQIPVTMASLKASHRTLDKKESLPYKPMHDHTRAIPIKPGEIYEYSLSMSCSHVFMPGHRLVLKVAAAAPKAPHHSSATTIGAMPFPWTTCYKIYHDEEHPSHLLLPVIPETPPDLWIDAPTFEQYLF